MKTVKHYYDIFNEVRATGDASLINSVTDPDGVDRSNVQAFVLEQQARHHLSITTKVAYSHWHFEIEGDSATVSFEYQPTGYNIDPTTRQPLEPEVTISPEHIVIILRRHGDESWLVFERQVVNAGA